MAIRDADLQPLMSALSGAPPRTQTKSALLLGASDLERVVRHLLCHPVLEMEWVVEIDSATFQQFVLIA